MSESKAATRAKNKYKLKNYDRLEIVVPKGHKATVQVAAGAAGESVNEYTNKALLNRLGLDDWPVLEEPTDDKK